MTKKGHFASVSTSNIFRTENIFFLQEKHWCT